MISVLVPQASEPSLNLVYRKLAIGGLWSLPHMTGLSYCH